MSGTFLTSCSNLHYLYIDIQEQPSISFSVENANTLLVNNALPQPIDSGITWIFDKKPELIPDSLKVENIAWNVIQTATKTIFNLDVNNDAAYYKYPTRTSGKWMETPLLDEDIREEIFTLDEYQVIISLDKIEYDLNLNVETLSSKNSPDLKYQIEDNVKMQLFVSLYAPGIKEKISTFVVCDSLNHQYIYTLGIDDDPLFDKLIEEILSGMATNLGRQLAYRFVPHWQTQTRIVYSGHSSRMKEAYSYATKDNWEAAEEIWTTLYNQEKNKKAQVKLAINLALTQELKDDYESGIDWLRKANRHAEESNLSDKSSEVIYIKEYLELLEKRRLSEDAPPIRLDSQTI
ncbi:DUF6340 family protein [Bacteroidales bacterium OttesenSCG-928-M11]|nr:DUF6340 family protein [Bacteroidales bacterium OttesenSCG-928-M11]